MESADSPPLPPVELLREWPSHWNLVDVVQGGASAIFPSPSRYLHPFCRLEIRDGRSRCLVAKQAIPAGELVLVDKPLALAKSQVALQEDTCKMASESHDFRKALLYHCGADDDEEERAKAAVGETLEVSAALVARILRRNCRSLSVSPLEEAGEGEEGQDSSHCAILPVASLANHSLRPNAVRVVIGHVVYLRLLQDLREGDEILENYLSPVLHRGTRTEILQAAHDMRDEGPDEFDSPCATMAEVGSLLEKAGALLEEEDKVEDAFKLLAEATNLCVTCENKDPAFAEAFSAFSKVAGCLGGGDTMHLEGAAMALEFANSRQPFSIVSCRLAFDLIEVQLGSLDKLDGAAKQSELKELGALEDLVREHVAKVYGPEPGLFEALCPTLVQRLDAARGSESKRCAPNAEEPCSKRPKLGTEHPDGVD